MVTQSLFRMGGLRPVFHVDANLINAKQLIPVMNQLESYADQGWVVLVMSKTAAGEASAGTRSEARSKKAKAYIQTLEAEDVIDVSEAYEEVKLRMAVCDEIGSVIFPRGLLSPSDQRDVAVVYEAIKYGAVLVTNDGDSRKQPGGILGCREVLKNRWGLVVMRVEEVVDLLEQFRDVH